MQESEFHDVAGGLYFRLEDLGQLLVRVIEGQSGEEFRVSF